MSLIDSLNSILDDLENEIKSVLSKYTVMRFMREPSRLDHYPICMVVPTETIPLYTSLPETIEEGDFIIHLYLVMRTPFDYKGSSLLKDLDILITELYSLRHDTTKWRELNYLDGIRYSYDPIEDGMLQGAEIILHIRK